jgi:hypothetical protein
MTSSKSSKPNPPAKATAKPQEKPKAAAKPAAPEKPKTAFPKEALRKDDWPDAREGKPVLETPESGPAEVPEETPRDDQEPIETRKEFVARVVAEDPAPVLLIREDVILTRPQLEQVGSEAAELLRHVASNPVDSHAPVWEPRTPNTTGGYS